MVNCGAEQTSTWPRLFTQPIICYLAALKAADGGGLMCPSPTPCAHAHMHKNTRSGHIFRASFCVTGVWLTQRWDSRVNTTWLNDTGVQARLRDPDSEVEFLRNFHTCTQTLHTIIISLLFFGKLDDIIFILSEVTVYRFWTEHTCW